MRQLAAIVVAFFLLAASAPVVACVTGATATAQESACCQTMRGKCGQSKANCCRVELRTNQSPQVSPVAVSHNLQPALQPVSLPSLPAKPALNSHRIQPWHAPSPPPLPAAGITILRL